MKQILFIGSLQWGKKSTGGGVQTKNQHFLRYLKRESNDCEFYDTYQKNNLLALIVSLYKIVRAKEKYLIILSIAYRGAYAIGTALRIMHVSRNIQFWVPGGDIADYVKVKQEAKREAFSQYRKIVVQAKYIKKDLDNLGYSNVEVVPNFKEIKFTPDVHVYQKDRFRFVYLSRIKNDKGVEEIIEAIRRLNRSDIVVDFYGTLINPYTKDYFANLKYLNINYKGFLDLNNESGYKVLSEYDAMLFPTYFKGEGFPGAIIDSFIAGVPVIASDFHANGEIIRDGENGILIKPKNVDSLIGAMMKVIKDKSYLARIREGAIKSAQLYHVDNVLDKLFAEII